MQTKLSKLQKTILRIAVEKEGKYAYLGVAVRWQIWPRRFKDSNGEITYLGAHEAKHRVSVARAIQRLVTRGLLVRVNPTKHAYRVTAEGKAIVLTNSI